MKISHDMSKQLVEHHRINDMLSDPAKVDKLTGFLFGRFSHRTDDTIPKNLHEEFEKLAYSQAKVSDSTLPQEVVGLDDDYEDVVVQDGEIPGRDE